MNNRRARIYSLVLDPTDKMAAILIAAIDQYLAIRAAEQPAPADRCGSSCPYCESEFASDTERDARRALSAHIRQIHHREWLRDWKNK